MASSDSSSTVQFITLAAIVVIGSCAAGYWIAGGLQREPDRQPVAQTSTPSLPTPPAPAASAAQAPSTPDPNGDYTAPNSSNIEIHEEKTPPPVPAKDKTPSDTAVASNGPDAEASQEADTPSSDVPETGTVGTVPSPVTGNATTPAASTQNSDPDYEQTQTASTAPAPTDSEATQEASTPGSPTSPEPATASAPADAKKPRFRVQVGTFTQAMSARSLADALRNRGLTATTVTDTRGDQTVYHVQTGAYRSRSSADRASLDLQREGFPAFVAPVTN